jgi:hypothetical protein
VQRDAVGPRPLRARQCGNDLVYNFQPDPLHKCCESWCCRDFEQQDDPRVVDARKPLYDAFMTPQQRKKALKANWNTVKVGGHQVCSNMICRIYACTRSFIYPKDPRGKQTQSESNRNRNRKAIAVCAWFEGLKEFLDIMPDQGGYFQVNLPRKRLVYKHYLDDCKLSPSVFFGCKSSYFYFLWRDHFPNIKIRKHCRFSKCCFCVNHRKIMAEGTREEASIAEEKLRRHIDWANFRERGMWHKKKVC